MQQLLLWVSRNNTITVLPHGAQHYIPPSSSTHNEAFPCTNFSTSRNKHSEMQCLNQKREKKKMAICYIAHCFISASQIPTADTDTLLSLSRSPPTWEAVRVMLSRAAQPTRLLTPFLRHAFTTTGLWKTISFSRQMILLLNHHAEGSKGKQAALPCSILGLLRQLSWLRQIRAIVMKTSAWISSTWSWKLIHHLQNSAS